MVETITQYSPPAFITSGQTPSPERKIIKYIALFNLLSQGTLKTLIMKQLAHFVLTSLFMSCLAYAYAQKIPIFQTPLYFEDSLGNKDTLVIGYDRNVKDDQLNPEYGEVWISTPMDSVFEVRAFHGDDFSQKMSKKIISKCGLDSGGFRINMSRYVTIWQGILWRECCHFARLANVLH